ncbi:MAG TPA: TIGR02266 family protein [Polyangiaceae bacterium]|nr:TIGR02266 family protein [Polyangiaceae bacterium]
MAQAVPSPTLIEEDLPSTDAPARRATVPKDRVESVAPNCVVREHERFVVDLQVSVHSEHNLYAGLAENISAGGLFIATHQLQPVGSRIQLSLSVADSEEEFQIVGEVRWVRVYNEHSDTSPGFGVRFTELPPGAAAAISRFLSQREPLFFDDE